jgi:signal transduction histidine kinase
MDNFSAISWMILVALIIMIVLTVYMLINLQKVRKENLRLANENDNLVDELERVKNELHINREKAGESDRLKSAFLCNMSHEIRTPLHAIMGFCGLIANSAISDSDKVKYANVINRNVDSMLELVNDIFDIAQAEAGITHVEDEQVKVNDLLGAVHTWLNLEKEHSGKEFLQVRVNKGNKDNDFVLYSDGYKLRRTLNNLAGNALKYSSEGYIDIGYRFGDGNMVEFYVKDEGIGFSKDKLDVMFKQFRQLDESQTRQYGGLGLGLSVAQKFVALLGGTMWAESEPGKGSTFWFAIPYRKEPISPIFLDSETEVLNAE